MKKQRAEEVMTRQPKGLGRNHTVADAVEIMNSEKCGFVPITDSDSNATLVGLLTDRDIALKSCCEGGQGPDTPVEKVMTTNLFCCSPDDDISSVCKTMERAGVRRIPVVDTEQKLVGVISMHDLAQTLSGSELGRTDDAILEQEPNN